MRFFILIVFLISILPGYCSGEIINEFVTDTKIKPYSFSDKRNYRARKLDCKNNSKPGLDLDINSQKTQKDINCPAISCPLNSENNCSLSTFLPYLRNSYRIPLSIVNNQSDLYQIDISDLNSPTGTFSYMVKVKVTNSEREKIYDNGKGLINNNTLVFSLPVYNSRALINLTCIGFLQGMESGLIEGVCTTFNQTDSGELERVGAKFTALAE